MPIHLMALLAGYILDFCFGDPHYRYHPICLMGDLIQRLETGIRSRFLKIKAEKITEKKEIIAGGVLAAAVIGVCGGVGGCCQGHTNAHSKRHFRRHKRFC